MPDRLQEILDGQTDAVEFEPDQNEPERENSRPELVARAELEEIVIDAMDGYLTGFEERLATSMQKALDTVLYEYNERLRSLEEDQARILRHLGLESDDS